MYIKLDVVTKVKNILFHLCFHKTSKPERDSERHVNKSLSLCHYLFPYQSFPSSLTINGMHSLFLHLLSSWGLTDALTNVHGIQHNELLCYFLEQRILQSIPST